jgi:hypothetical protein
MPEAACGDADQILLAAAAGGADLKDLAALAEEMHRRSAAPDADGDDDGRFIEECPFSVSGSAASLSADERSPPGLDLHQPFTGQRLDDLARRGLADPVVLADLPQARHLLPRLERPRLDLVLQRGEDARGGQFGLSGHKISLPAGS